MRDKKPTLFDLLEQADIDMKYFFELMEMGVKFEDWKDQARKYRQREIDSNSSANRTWEGGNYFAQDDVFSREFWVDCFDSPLESLMHTTIDMDILPPPEIIMVIANQFKYYLMKGGDISLEEAFFGSSVGKGNYAYRKHHENELYSAFDGRLRVGKLKNEDLNQEALLEELINTPQYHKDRDGSEHQCNPFYRLKDDDSFQLDSFLRGYRRWKNKKQE